MSLLVAKQVTYFHQIFHPDPDVVTPIFSMGTQLASRESALQALVTFIGENGGLSKVLRRLCSD